MEIKKSILILIMAIFLISIAGVCASDADNVTVASEDVNQIELSSSIEITEDNLQTTEKDNTLTQADDCEIRGADENGTFTGLQKEIYDAGNGTLNLTKNYYWDENFTDYGIFINDSITINGNGFTIDASNHHGTRIFDIRAKSAVILNNITFKNGNSDGCGGAINVWYDLSDSKFTNLNFINNAAADNGGAIRFRYASTNNLFENITFENNRDSKNGGAFYIGLASSSNTFRYVKFINNTANKNGGALYLNYTSTSDTFENVIFENNTAKSNDGGAINFHNKVDGATFTEVLFNNSHADNNVGGAINIDKGIANSIFNNTYFIDNAAKKAGAIGITGDISSLTFENTGFINNTALENGGAIYIGPWGLTDLANTAFKDVSFINNTAANNGGALYVRKNTKSNIFENVEFINNTAKASSGGAVRFGAATYQYTTEGNTFKKVLFANNTASNNGGALYVTGESTSNIFEYVTFVNNTAKSNDGGAINFYKAVNDTTFNKVIFHKNSAPGSRSGAINFDKGMKNSRFNNTIFADNSALYTSVITLSGVTSSNTFENTEFLNNTAGYYLIYVNNATSDNIIRDSIFLNNNASLISVKNGTIQFTDNWFGNNATNYNENPNVYENLDNWLFLNATVSPAAITLDQNSTIKFKFYSYDNNTDTTGEYDGSASVPLNLYSTLGLANKHVALTNEEIVYTPSEEGNGTLTAKYLNAYYTATIENNKIPTTIIPTADSYVGHVDDTWDNLAVLHDKDGKNITDEYILNYTSSNPGVAVVENGKIKALGAGTAIITVTFTGNGRYAAAENKTINVTVDKIPTAIESTSVTTVYNVDKNILITLKDANGNPISGVPITVNLKGAKTYTTDKNGQIKVSTKGLAPKTYDVKISFGGNGKYVKSVANAKVIVKKAKPKLFAKKKTYKAKAKTKKFTVTLKNNKGKPIKKAKVRLIVKKIKTKKSKKAKKKTSKKSKKKIKKNIVKTNKKGKATFKVKVTKKGKYQAIIKYNGNKFYTAITKKVKITIK